MRTYLNAVLGVAPEIDLAFCVPTLAEAIAVAPDDLDLCLIDMQLPDGDGTDFVTHLSKTSGAKALILTCLLYTSPSPRDQRGSRMPSSA